jgi:hypothetical protein
MFNLKWGVIFGGAAFALALITSLTLGQTTLLVALVRALCFMILFFGIGIGAWAVIVIFIPDLLPTGSPHDDAVANVFSGESAGSRVNITLDDESDAALPDTDYDSPESGEVGHFSDLIADSISSGANITEDVDETPNAGYTGGTEDLAPAFENIKLSGPGDFSLDFGAFVLDGSDDGEAGGTDSSAGSSSPFSGGGSFGDFDDTPAPAPKTSSGNKPMKLEGDFDPKEIAAGLRTVLKKEG